MAILFTDSRKIYKYIYARKYEYYRESKRKRVLRTDNSLVYVYVTGVPENVSPYANEAMITKETKRRLFIMSDEPLFHDDLCILDKEYGEENPIYPIFYLDVPNKKLVSKPKNNYFECEGVPSSVSEFLEYKYLIQRYIPSNIIFDKKNKLVHSPFILPFKVPTIIIMPYNFTLTGPKTGYFEFDNIIIRVFSKHLLSCAGKRDNHDKGLITDFSTQNSVVVQIVEDFFHELGMINIYTPDMNQIIAKDKYLTLIFGSTSNLILPT